MKGKPLFQDYSFAEVGREVFDPFFIEHCPKIYECTLDIWVEDWLDEEAKRRQNLLYLQMEDRLTYRIFIYKGDLVIGWHTGWMLDQDMYYMSNTSLLKAYHGRGVYSALLPELLELFRAKGFQKIVSRHYASNNSVLIPKLKAGFAITGMEVDERYGLFVSMAYYYEEKRRKAYEFRTGAIRPDEDLKKYL